MLASPERRRASARADAKRQATLWAFNVTTGPHMDEEKVPRGGISRTQVEKKGAAKRKHMEGKRAKMKRRRKG